MSNWIVVLLSAVTSRAGLVSTTTEATPDTPVKRSNNESTTPEPTPISDIDEDGLMAAIREALTEVILTPIEWVSGSLTDVVAALFADYPDVRQPWVQEVHGMVFTVTLVLAVAAIVWIGITHMLNQTDGVRPVVLILAALGFGAVAPDLLWYPVELSAQTTEALLPKDPEFRGSIQFTLQMALIAILDVFIILGIVLLFLARNVYLLLGVALAPLLALLAVLPGIRRYAWMLANIWVAFLLIGPLNAVLLDLLLQMMAADGFVPEWLWGLAGVTMLLGLPLTVLSAGAVMVGPGLSLMRNIRSTVYRQAGRFRNGQRKNGGRGPPRGSDTGFGSGGSGPGRGRSSRGGRRAGDTRRPARGGADRGNHANRFDWRDQR